MECKIRVCNNKKCEENARKPWMPHIHEYDTVDAFERDLPENVEMREVGYNHIVYYMQYGDHISVVGLLIKKEDHYIAPYCGAVQKDKTLYICPYNTQCKCLD